jgi:hypothetical protein
VRCVAVDWSGRARGAEQFIWIAEARDGELVFLENGRTRAQAITWVIAAAAADPGLVAGFDFAFSLPAWYCAERGWAGAPQVWAGVAADGERLLAECPPPFWGRPGHPRPHPADRGRRRTERDDAPGAKSVFQIGGSGAVGTGSLRGMGYLPTLHAAGFAIWPLAGAGLPAAVEIYPRAMYGPAVRKSRAGERRAVLDDRFPGLGGVLRERAQSTEDAFDAAVSALVMSAHADELADRPPAPADALEGRVWIPTAPAS